MLARLYRAGELTTSAVLPSLQSTTVALATP
jgi:hypothetical protein